MNKYVRNLIFSFSFLLISLFIAGIIIVLLHYNTEISLKTIRIVSLIISSILFLFSAVINGKLNKKRGIINGIIMSSIYLLVIFILKLFNIEIILTSIIIKSILLIVGNILGVNL